MISSTAGPLEPNWSISNGIIVCPHRCKFVESQLFKSGLTQLMTSPGESELQERGFEKNKLPRMALTMYSTETGVMSVQIVEPILSTALLKASSVAGRDCLGSLSIQPARNLSASCGRPDNFSVNTDRSSTLMSTLNEPKSVPSQPQTWDLSTPLQSHRR